MGHTPYKVLLIEDDPGHAELAKRSLHPQAGGEFNVAWVTTLADAVSRLRDENFDVVLMDLTLPDCDGVKSVAAIKRYQPDLPIVVLTSLASDEMASALLQQGVQDYLLKHCLVAAGWGAQALVRAIQYAMHRQQASREIQRLYKHAQSQQELLNEKNRRLSKLFAVAQKVVENVSHEFRTPLTVIKEYVSLLHDGVLGEINLDQKRFLDVVADRAEDLNRMVDDMLDVGKLDAGLLTVRRGQCEVHEIIKHVLGSLSRKAAIRGVQLEVVIDQDLPSVFCDEDKAGRTIVNLATNAIKFARDAGHVCLTARYDRRAQEVVIEVTDDGPGIQSRDLQRIFHRFTQVDLEFNGSTRGFGLGLSIAREMVELNFGRINVTSQPGVGSCFSFTLPVADAGVISRRFIEHLGRAKNKPATLAVCLIQADDASASQLDDFEPFLYYVLHAGDLALRIGEKVWIIFVAGDMDAYEKMRRRAGKLLQEANRNRIGMPLPNYVSTLVGRWQANDDVESILAEIVKVLPRKEEVDAHPVLQT